ncbi:MAG: ATP-binding protein [Opitutaceae bacterium]|nr:ATP-binding protein [Opitutaceae bacterium]
MSVADHKAVFLSYASQDAEAARRICEALRSAGIEVWFDQSELPGGDAWDQKIRKQIKECALFVPIISANTQARAEGYFRLEWKLAADRSHLIARDHPFLVPVVIYDTNNAAARVPEEFHAVQWTGLEFGRANEAFAARIRSLLGGSEMEPGRPRPGQRDEGGASPGKFRYANRGWFVPAIFGIAAVVALTIWRPWHRPGSVSDRLPSSPPAVAKPPTEAERLIGQIWPIYEKQTDGTGEEWALATELGAQAVKLEPANAEAWAAYSIATWANWYYSGASKEGQVPARRLAERAVALDGSSVAARLALANVQRHSSPTLKAAESLLRQLVAESPSDKRVLRLLADVLRRRTFAETQRVTRDGLQQEMLTFLDRAAALPGGDPNALMFKANVLAGQSRYREARSIVEEAIKLRNGPTAFTAKVNLMFQLDGDLDGALAELERAPAAFWRKETNIAFATWLALCKRDARRALTYLRMITSDYVDGGETGLEGGVSVPKGVLMGLRHEVIGNRSVALNEWRGALRVVDDCLESDRSAVHWLAWKAWLHAALDEKDQAQVALRRRRAGTGRAPSPVSADGVVSINRGLWPRPTTELAHIYLRLGNFGAVLTALEREVVALGTHVHGPDLAAILRNRLRFDPGWDPLRRDERFGDVLRNLETRAAGIAHDFNNALAPIVMGCPLLRMGVSDPGGQRILDTMEKSAERSVALVRQLLSFARGGSGRSLLLQSRHVLQEVTELVEVTFPKTIRVAACLPRDLWLVQGNPTQLHQVFLNLCINARDAMPQGGELTLTAANRHLEHTAAAEIADARPGAFLTVEVRDTGTGIPPDVLARIWEPFFTTKGEGKGTGLGLSTVRGIVHTHGGFVTVTTRPGQGTAFAVFLPAAENGVSDGQVEVAPVSSARGNGELILVVDDEEPVREITTRVLTDHGYRVVTACDGAEAIALFTQRAPEVKLLLTDMQMPILGGADLAKVLRRLQPSLPAVAMSGQVEPDSVAPKGFATAFLVKPFQAETLLSLMRRTLDASTGTDLTGSRRDSRHCLPDDGTPSPPCP